MVPFFVLLLIASPSYGQKERITPVGEFGPRPKPPTPVGQKGVGAVDKRIVKINIGSSTPVGGHGKRPVVSNKGPTPVGEYGNRPEVENTGLTPVGGVGQHPTVDNITPIGEIAVGTNNAANAFSSWQAIIQRIHAQVQAQMQIASQIFIPSEIDNWMAESGIGSSTAAHAGVSPSCLRGWFIGCEPWHSALPPCWRRYIRQYNPKYNYRSWKAHVDEFRIPQLTAILTEAMRSGVLARDACVAAMPF